MKKKLLYLILIPLLSAFQCDEDEYVPDYVIENSNLIEIEDNKTTFLVDDYIIINTDINNQQTATNTGTIDLTDFIVGNEFSLYYSLVLYRINDANEEIPYFVENVEVENGLIEFNDQNPFFNITSPYSELEDTFKSKIGIKLSEPGRYLLKSDAILDDKHQIIFDLRGLTSVGDLRLTTSILNSDEDGIYRFTVE